MKRILITGGTGFIGSNFVRHFLKEGYEVAISAREKSNFWRIEPLLNELDVHRVDLTDSVAVRDLISKLKPQVVLHFAIYGSHWEREIEVEDIIRINTCSTINLVNACADAGVDCFINAGSSSEYGFKDHPISENDALEPVGAYAISKAAGSLYCEHLAKKRKLPFLNVRLFSPYGFFDDRTRFIPIAILSFLNDKIPILGNKNGMRDYVFINDVISAYDLLIKNAGDFGGKTFNLGTGIQYSRKQVVDTLFEIIKPKIDPGQILYNTLLDGSNEPKMWVADISRLRESTGWTPAQDLTSGLRLTVDWFKKNKFLYE